MPTITQMLRIGMLTYHMQHLSKRPVCKWSAPLHFVNLDVSSGRIPLKILKYWSIHIRYTVVLVKVIFIVVDLH